MTEFSSKRRLTTILAADIVSYSKHMSTNEEGTLRTLKRHMIVIEPIVNAQNGRIFDTAGDAFLAEFKSTVEAVRAAILIQEAVALSNEAPDVDPKLDFRIGINVGDVIDEEGRLYGDGINVACRLEGLASPGNICVSGSVYELVKNKLSYRFHSMGEQHVKNIAEPISTFSLLSDYDASLVNHLELKPNAQKSTEFSSSALSNYKIPAFILLFLIVALAGLHFSGGEESIKAPDLEQQKTVRDDLAGKWLVGTDNKKHTGTAVQLLNNQDARIVVHNLKTEKTRRLKKKGSWQIQNDGKLCITVPLNDLKSCFGLSKNENNWQLTNHRSSEIDWLLVNDTRF